jgi:hypothetical protein
MPRKGRGDRDWRRYERDWKGYERYRRDEVNLFLELPELQLKLAELVREKHLSVRQLERLTRRILSEMPNGCICKQCPNYPCKHIPEQNNLLDAILGESFHQKQQTPATPSLKCQSR